MCPDKYRDFQELSQNSVPDEDYKIEVRDRHSPVSVIAIHGGRIEPGTSEIAAAIAGEDFNLYLFEGIRDKDNKELHITSSSFDEAAAQALVRKSDLCISIHGFAESDKKIVCIGGLNAQLGEFLLGNILKAGLVEQETANPLDKYHGVRTDNIVNLSRRKGAQIEISRPLREMLCAQPEKMALFAAAVRQSITDYSASPHLQQPQSKGKQHDGHRRHYRA
jgi:phage replication-related protein YjqB (UPF0714/DUF867 family)